VPELEHFASRFHMRLTHFPAGFVNRPPDLAVHVAHGGRPFPPSFRGRPIRIRTRAVSVYASPIRRHASPIRRHASPIRVRAGAIEAVSNLGRFAAQIGAHAFHTAPKLRARIPLKVPAGIPS